MVLMDKEIEFYLVQVADKANQLGWDASLCCLGEVDNSKLKPDSVRGLFVILTESPRWEKPGS